MLSDAHMAVDKYPLFMIASVMFLAEILKIWETIGVKS